MCPVNINRPPKCLLILSCPPSRLVGGNPVALKKKEGFVHINFRHKAQLHIKALITHLVMEKNVLAIENPQGYICFHKPTSEANSRPRTPLTQPFFLYRAESCGKNKCFLVEPYLAAPRSAHTRSSGHGIQMHSSRAEQCVEKTPFAHTVPGLGLKVWDAETPEVGSDCGWISEASFHRPQ